MGGTRGVGPTTSGLDSFASTALELHGRYACGRGRSISQDLTTLIDTIRLSALKPQAWEDVQAKTEAYFGWSASQLCIIDHKHGNAFSSQTSHVPEIDAHLQTAAAYGEPVIYAATTPHWRHFCDYDYITEEIARRLFYQASDTFGLAIFSSPG